MLQKIMQRPGKAAAKKKILNQDESHAFAHNIIQSWKNALTILLDAVKENEKGWAEIWSSYSALHSAVDSIYAKEDSGVRSTTRKLQDDSALVQNNASHDAPKALSDSKRELSQILDRVRKTEKLQNDRLELARQFKQYEKKANEAAQKGAHDRLAKNRKAAAESGDKLNRATEDLYIELESIDKDRLAIVDRAVRAILEMQTFVFLSNPVANALKMANDQAIGNRAIPQDTAIDWDAYKPASVCAPGHSGCLAPYPATQQAYQHAPHASYRPQAPLSQHQPNFQQYQPPTTPTSQPYLPQSPFPYQAPSPSPVPYHPASAAPSPHPYSRPPTRPSNQLPTTHTPATPPGNPPPPRPGHFPPPPLGLTSPPPPGHPPPPPPGHPPPPPPGHPPPPPPGHPPPPPPGHPPPPPPGHPPPPPPGHPPQALGIPAVSPPGLHVGSTSPVQNQPGPPPGPPTFPGNQAAGVGIAQHVYKPTPPGLDPPGPPRPGTTPARPSEIRPQQSPDVQFLLQHGGRPPAHAEIHQGPSPGNSNPGLGGGYMPHMPAGNPLLPPGSHAPSPPAGRPPEVQPGTSAGMQGMAPVSTAAGHPAVAPSAAAPTQGGPMFPVSRPFIGKPPQAAAYTPGGQAVASSSGYGGPAVVSQQVSGVYTPGTSGGNIAAQAGPGVSSHSLTGNMGGQMAGAGGSEQSAGGSGPLPSEMEFLSGYGAGELGEGKTPSLGPRPQSSQGSLEGAGGFDEGQGVAIAKIDVGGGMESMDKINGGGFGSGSEYLPPEVQLSRPPHAGGGVGQSQNPVVPPGYPLVPPAVEPSGAVCYLPKPPSLYPGNSEHEGSGGVSQWHNASQGKLDMGVGAKIQYNRSGSRGSDSVSADEVSEQVGQLDINEKR